MQSVFSVGAVIQRDDSTSGVVQISATDDNTVGLAIGLSGAAAQVNVPLCCIADGPVRGNLCTPGVDIAGLQVYVAAALIGSAGGGYAGILQIEIAAATVICAADGDVDVSSTQPGFTQVCTTGADIELQ